MKISPSSHAIFVSLNLTLTLALSLSLPVYFLSLLLPPASLSLCHSLPTSTDSQPPTPTKAYSSRDHTLGPGTGHTTAQTNNNDTTHTPTHPLARTDARCRGTRRQPHGGGLDEVLVASSGTQTPYVTLGTVLVRSVRIITASTTEH